MQKFVISISTGLALTACTTFSDVENGLNNANGRHVNFLIDQIGFPTSTQEFAGRKVYTWSSSRQAPTFNQTIGPGGWPMLTPGPSVTYDCTIRAEVDQAETILNSTFEGNIGGCERYARALRG